MFEKILKNRLEINIREELNNRHYSIEDVTKRQYSGLVKVLARILMYSENHKHFSNTGHYDGNHIMYSEFKLLKKNNISKYFINYKLDNDGEYVGEQLPFFERADNSTYHANNSRFGSNGYAHWYIYSPVIRKSINQAYTLFEKMVTNNSKFGSSADKYEAKLSEAVQLPQHADLDNYLIVPKVRFMHVVNKFIEGIYEGASTLIQRLEYVDENYVYILNEVEPSNRLNGRSRNYTTLSLLRKDVRKFLLKGYTEVDISTSVQSVFANLYYDLKLDDETFKSEFPLHYEMITNKTRFREKVSYWFKCDIKQAKQIITSITQSPKQRIFFKYCTQRGMSAKAIKHCKKLIQPFIDEAITIQEEIISKYYTNSTLKDMIDNDIAEANKKLKGNGKGKSLDSRRAFRIYEIFESVIRKEMLNQVSATKYQIHDCVLFNREPDINELRRVIFERTKFKMLFEMDRY